MPNGKIILYVSAAVFAFFIYLMKKRNGLDKFGCVCSFGTFFSVCGIGVGTRFILESEEPAPFSAVFGCVLFLGIMVYGIYASFTSISEGTERDWERYD